MKSLDKTKVYHTNNLTHYQLDELRDELIKSDPKSKRYWIDELRVGSVIYYSDFGNEWLIDKRKRRLCEAFSILSLFVTSMEELDKSEIYSLDNINDTQKISVIEWLYHNGMALFDILSDLDKGKLLYYSDIWNSWRFNDPDNLDLIEKKVICITVKITQ